MKRISLFLVAAWAVLLAGAVASPWLVASASAGDDVIRGTVRVSLAFYAAAVGLMFFLRPRDWNASGPGQLARWCWSLAWAAFVVHVAAAFHFYHGWSHADAARHTEEVSGFGPGIYVSHLFTLLWTVDGRVVVASARQLCGAPRPGRPDAARVHGVHCLQRYRGIREGPDPLGGFDDVRGVRWIVAARPCPSDGT